MSTQTAWVVDVIEQIILHCPLELLQLGKSPLSWAASEGAVEAAELLLESGADMETRDNVGTLLLTIPIYINAAHIFLQCKFCFQDWVVPRTVACHVRKIN